MESTSALPRIPAADCATHTQSCKVRMSLQGPLILSLFLRFSPAYFFLGYFSTASGSHFMLSRPHAVYSFAALYESILLGIPHSGLRAH